MTARRPFHFGIQAYHAASAGEWAEKARRAEALGYATFTVPDHFGDYFAPGPALMAVAAATTTLRVGTLVACNDFRHPLVLAKEMATLDVLSGGRVQLGLGAGWMQAEYAQAGISFDPPGRRIARLAEAVQVIKQLWSGEPVDFCGEQYRVTGITGFPRPIQQPHPPLLIGGGGRRILSLAAREADIVSVNPRITGKGLDRSSIGTAATAQKVAWVREVAGERFDALEVHTQVHVAAITDDRPAAAGPLAARLGLTVEQVLDSPQVLAGSVEQIVARLHELRERTGLSYFVVFDHSMEAFAPIVARLAGR